MPRAKDRVTLTCQLCQRRYEVPRSRAEKSKYCGKDCHVVGRSRDQRKPRAVLKCEQCGKEFLEHQCHADRRRFCSMECRSSSERYRSGQSERSAGESNGYWKGGRAIHSAGYVYMRQPRHPFCGRHQYVFEHRLVMEKWMREAAPDHEWLVEAGGEKYLAPDIQVHHINEQKDDNRRENLVAITAAAHRRLHNGNECSAGDYWPEVEHLLI